MNLKRIELYGFKSFADRVSIDFESSITGIVGPNGCGKSNVADAVRWVLGEQSPSVLRCKKMTEVIFSGTTNRKSLSYCEVSLFLDNEKKFYPVEYDEVVITRKLYRSGDSEYYINRNLCRWRDIIDLFRDSGVGREGYSIIGQGKIEEILSAKPEARRQIFEEAAGISRHKAKRLETERSLDRTRINMSRLYDMLSEIESTLAPLESEAKNAAKARELRKRMKLIDVYYFLYQCENSANERDKIRKRLEKFASEASELQVSLENAAKEYNVAMIDIANSDIYANNLRDKITEYMVEAERRAGESRLFGERLNNLRKEAADIISETAVYEDRRREREKDREQNSALYNEAAASLRDKKSEYENLSREYEKLKRDVDRQEIELDKSKELIFSSMDKLAEIDKNQASLIIERDMLADGMGQGKEEYKEKSRRYEELKRDRQALSEKLNGLLNEKDIKEKEKAGALKNLTDSAAEAADAESRKRKTEQRVDELDIKIKMLEDMKRDYSGYYDVVRRLMNEAEHNTEVKRMILGTVGQSVSVPKDLQLAIEVALGNAVQNIITDNERDAGKLIDLLKAKGYGRATFMPISTVRPGKLSGDYERALDEDGVIGIASELIRYDRKFTGVISNLLGKTIIADDKETAIRIAKKYGYGFRIVTLDGVVFSQSGTMTGGSAPGKSTRILSRESELEDLKKKRKNAHNELSMLIEETSELVAERGEIEKAVKIIEARINLLDKEIGSLNVRIEAVDSEAAIFKKDIDRLYATSGDSAARIKELDAMIAAAGTSKDNLKTERVDADDFINEARDRFLNDKQAMNAMGDKVTAVLLELNALENSLERINKDIAQNKADYTLIVQKLLDLRARSVTNAKEIEKAEEKVDTAQFSAEDKEKIDAMKQEVQDIDEHKKMTQERVAELNAIRDELNSALSAANENRVREEGLLERLEIDINNLSERISGDYDMDYEAAKLFKEETVVEEGFEFDPAKAPQESASLRRKIERLGPLNELAEQKFQETQERFTELNTQYEDMSKAEADMVKLIAQLTTEMTEKFSTSFRQININFQEVFRELFNGGSAKLELETAEGCGVLEAGIEIIAEPPGKKPSRISLLSGGERAMTAIAILFAIIKLKPMPFSILDEIEAALDEANADLFAQYLRKFSKQTQFIVVTHRKPTMALADVLYGVTNQEKGVSTLVSVRLEDALKTAEEAK